MPELLWQQTLFNMKNKLLAGLLFLFVSYLSYGQSLNVSLSPQNPTLCSGAQTVLSTTVSGGTAPYTYLWSTGETSSAISANKAINYAVTVTDRNGNKGTAQVTVTAITRPDAPTVVSSAIIVCPGSPARLEVANPLTNAIYHWYDATGNALSGTGPVFNTAPISQNTTFFVDATVSGCTSERSAIVVVLRDPPTVNRVSVCAGSPAVFTANGADSYIWYDAAGTIVQSGGNMFTTGALTTGTSFYVTGTTNGCTSVKVEARADVKPKTPNPNGGGPYAVCNGSNITLSASGVNGAIYEWFDHPTGGVPIISSPDFTTPILTQNTTYYVQATIDGCPSDRIAVNITVSQPPSLPTASSNSPACYNSPAQLTVTNPEGGVIYHWYTSATSTQIYRTGISVTTDPLITNTTFYVRAERGACLSDAVAVPVTVNSAVVAPTVTGATVTCPGTTTLTATAPAGTLFNWYNSSTGGTPVFTGNVFNAPATSSRSYFVSVTNPGGCESARTQVDITVTAPPAAPVGTDGRACIGSSATLRATGAVNYLWYENQTGGVPVGTGATFVTPVITATTNYFVSAVDASGCESSTRTRVRAIVVTTPAMPTVSGTSTICEGTSATLTASGSTSSYEWWTDEFNGVRLATTATFNTGSLSTNTTFWVQAVTPEGCASPRRSRDVTVTSRVSPQFQYSSGTYCTTSPATTPTAFVPGTFSASPGGLTISTSNGRITPATSVPGNYTITFTPSGGACNTPTNATIVITAAPVATFHYPNAEYCNNGSATPVFAFGASAGTFSASPAGLVFRDATAGEINLTNSTPGTYTITNTITTPCGNATATFNITINRGVVVNAGSDITLQAGNTMQLNGTVSIPGLGVTWTSSNPADVFSNPNSLTTDYTPAATSGTTTLTLTTADPDPSGPCDARSNTLVVRIISTPAPPTVADQTICYNTKATLTATAPGGTYKWYDQPAGGPLLFTGNPYITANLTAGTNLYVTATVNGLESDRKIVSITVNPYIAEPTVTGAGAVCPGKVTLTVNETADAYEWRDSNGNLKSTSKVFEPTISQNTAYIVRIRIGNCFSPAHQVSLTTNPTATVNSASTGQVCSGSAQNYTITSATNNATFTYSRAQKAGISEAAVSNVASSQITEILTNTTNNEITVTYIITPYLNGCAGAPFNYTVTVLPTPVITSANSKTACNKAPLNYLVQMSPSVNNYFSWSRAAVPGISNAAISGQASMNIRESLINTTKAPIDVVYTFNYGTTSCPGAPFNLTVTVNPDVTITSSDFTFACSGSPVGYQITSDVTGATFRWQRLTALPGQPAHTTLTTSGTINEVLTNNSTQQVFVDYFVIPQFNGCDGTPLSLRVILAPAIPKPHVNSNTPVCIEKTIILNSDITGDKYIWTSSSGFLQETTVPYINIPATASGTFKYRVEVKRGNCSNTSDYFTIEVYQKPVANAGGDRTVCYDATSVPLAGQVNGHVDGRPIGGTWDIVTGTGSFSANTNVLANSYIPTQADRDAGTVVLSLTSLDPAACEQDIALIKITFGKLQAANAGPDRDVCEQSFELSGQILVTGATGNWDGGTGTFVDGRNSLNGAYIPSQAERNAGFVTLTLTAIGAGPCDEAGDEVTFKLLPPPTVQADAGTVRYGQRGKTITLNPIVSDANVTYQWTETPSVGSISNPNVKTPVITVADVDVTYKLIVTAASGCVSAEATILVISSPEISAPNTFTPNADGYNDVWLITGMEAYPGAIVDIFDRTGRPIYHSIGYAKPWDGTSNGKPVPFGTYYFVINTRDGEQQKLTGYVTVVR